MTLGTRFLVLLLLLAPAAVAQQVGDCALGTAEKVLDINDVRAHVFNGGNLFYGNVTTNGNGYLVPGSTGNSPIFASQFWVGGKVDGELRMAASKYDRFEFWPGPLDEAGNPPADCAAYDRIYRVSRGDVARYYATGEMTDDLRDWPVHLGAPVLDGDGVAGNYNLAGGDQPAIMGEQMAWWVMNDAGNEHQWSRVPPLGLEARVSAFAAPSTVPALHQATFYRYRLTYRGDQPLDSAYVAVFVDADLGDAGDDYIGSDTTLHMGFAYNAYETDAFYGIPPAVGLKVVRGPVGLPNGRDDDGDGMVDEPGERLGMTAAPCHAKTLEPVNGEEAYNCMQALWPDGTPLTEGGWGYRTDGPPIAFSFPGDPVTQQFWSEENMDGNGAPNNPGDRRFVVVTGPFRMEPGDEQEVVFAVPFARGEDRLDSVVRLRRAARYVQNAFDVGALDPRRVDGFPLAPPLPSVYGLSRPYPNPFRDAATLTLTVPERAGPLRLAVYDVLGREVTVLAEGVLTPGEHALTLDGAGLPSGLYLVRLETGRQTETVKLLHLD